MLRADAFSRMLAAIPEDIIEPGRKLERFEDGSQSVRLFFEDGETNGADLLVGADGIRSTVARQRFRDPHLFHCGIQVWLAWCYCEGIPRGVSFISHSPTIQASFFPMLHHGREAFEWWVVEPWDEGVQFNGRIRDHLMARIEGWCDPLPRLTTSEYEPKVISPEEAHSVWSRLKQPESTLVLLVAVTGLRISEALALKWSDIDPKAELIHVKRSWTIDRIGKPKSKASRAAVPCVELLSQHLEEWRRESPYAGDDDWVFPSVRNKGKTPRSGSILVTDYLKRAAYDAGVLKKGEKVQFGMHNLRHSLATYLIAVGRDVKTVQTILRQANPMTTLQRYAHGRSQDRPDAQGEMLSAFFAPPAKPSTETVQ
jgi:integrase